MRQRPARTLAVVASLVTVATLVAGCSRHTALTVEADLVPFMSASETQATISYGTGTADVQLPFSNATPNPGEAVDLTQLGVPADAAAAITAFDLDLAASVTPTTAIGAGTVSIYLAGASASDAFQPQYRVAQKQTPAMPAGQATTVDATLKLDSQANPGALKRLQSGSFRIGIELQASAGAAGSADVALTRLRVSLSLPHGWGLP